MSATGSHELIGVAQPTDDSCLPACLATILRVPLEEVPEVRFSLGDAWWPVFVDAVIDAFGVQLMNVEPAPPPRGCWIAVVPSLTVPDKHHAVVMHAARLAWDPSQKHRRDHVLLADVASCFLLVPLRAAPAPGSQIRVLPGA